MTRQPDDPGPDYEGTRYDQHGDPVMPWEGVREPLRWWAETICSAVFSAAVLGALLIWWLT